METEERATGGAGPVDDVGTTAVAGDRPAPVPPDAAQAEAAGSERCQHHPARAAAARCAGCDGPLCLSCAVPVRGRVFGPECVADELGDPDLMVPPEPDRSRPGSWVAAVGAALALVGTIGPWTRTGAGDRVLGAWVPNVRWSTVAAVGAVALVLAAWRLRAHRGRPTLVIVAGTVVAVASTLAIVFPPTFQVASWGPWLGVAGGAIATVAGIAIVVVERRPSQGV